MYIITYFVISSSCETCFPLLKSRDICISSYRYQNGSGTFKLLLWLSESRVLVPVVVKDYTDSAMDKNSGNVQYTDQLHRLV